MNWYEVKEKSKIGLGYKIMFVLLKITPAVFMRILAFPVGFFYWLFAPSARHVSKAFLQTVSSCRQTGDSDRGAKNSTLAHFISFALNLVENVQSWGGKFSFKDVIWQDDDVADLVKNINAGKGCLCLVSHLGNAQLMRALASENQAGTARKMSVTSITDTKITGGFVKLINSINPDSSLNVISSDEIGPETIIILQERLEKGELVVIAGDRISANTDRTLNSTFMNKTARFPYGVFLLVSLLNVPSYFIGGLRQKDFSLKPKYQMFVKKIPYDFNCPRKERAERIQKTCDFYSSALEHFAKQKPYQWYNFFDFWQ